MQQIKVLKFGGGVFSDDDKLPAIAAAIEHEMRPDYKIIAVLSAMGNTTQKLKDLFPRHLIPNPSLREYDSYVSNGENMAVPILAAYLVQNGIKAKSFQGWQAGIITDEIFTDANVVKVKTEILLEFFKENDVAVLTGFQGMTEAGEITTLGLNGSDLTAAVAADWFNAAKCVLFKDVDGVYTGKPRDLKSELYKFVTPDTLLSSKIGKSGIVHDKALAYFDKMFADGRTTEIVVRNIDLSRRQFTTICQDKVEYWG